MRNERICRSKIAAALIFLTVSRLALPGSGRAQATSYLNHDQLTRELRSLVNSSGMARMSSVGTSIEGREIWVVELGNPDGKPTAERQPFSIRQTFIAARVDRDPLEGPAARRGVGSTALWLWVK